MRVHLRLPRNAARLMREHYLRAQREFRAADARREAALEALMLEGLRRLVLAGVAAKGPPS